MYEHSNIVFRILEWFHLILIKVHRTGTNIYCTEPRGTGTRWREREWGEEEREEGKGEG